MKKLQILCFLLSWHFMSNAQHVYKIKTDSLKVTNDSCTAELILENSTRNVNGFLYNKGNGRTEFRQPVVKVGDSVTVWGGDTLQLGEVAGIKHVGNGLSESGDSIRLGGVLSDQTIVNMNKKSFIFNITDGSTPYKGADVRIKGVRDTITIANNFYVQHYQTGGRVSGDASGIGSIYAETWYNTTDSFNTGAFANYVSRHKSSFATRMQSMRLFGFRSFFENYATGNYGEFNHFHAQHVWGNSGYIDRIYGLRLAYMKGPNTTHAYAIYTEGQEDSIVFSGPMRIAKYKNNAAADSVLAVDSIGNVFLKAAGSLGVNKSVQALNDSSTVVWDLNEGINGSLLLEGIDRSLEIQNPIAGHTYKLKIQQDSVGGRSIEDWPSGTMWSRGVTPVLTSMPNSIDMVSLYYDGTNYFGTFEPQYSDTPPNVSIYAYDAKVGTSSNDHTLTNVPAGSLLVLTTSFGTHLENASISSTPSLSWVKRADASEDESGDAEIYTALFSTGGNITVTSSWGFPYVQASTCYVIINQENSLDGAIEIQEGQSAPSVGITSTRANSILIGVTSDWNAINGSTRTLRSSATETNYSYTLGDVTSYHYYLAAPTITSYTLGLSAPTGQSGGTCVIEIRGNN